MEAGEGFSFGLQRMPVEYDSQGVTHAARGKHAADLVRVVRIVG